MRISISRKEKKDQRLVQKNLFRLNHLRKNSFDLNLPNKKKTQWQILVRD